MTSCADCPDLAADRMPEGWTPRARCCRDEHLERRLAGDFRPWAGPADALIRSIEGEARTERRARRAALLSTSGMNPNGGPTE